MDTKKKTSLKTNKKPKKSSKAKLIDNVKRSPQEKRQQQLEEIALKTGLGENEILEAEEKFKEDYPDGRISLEEFVDQSDVSGGLLILLKPKGPNLNVFAKEEPLLSRYYLIICDKQKYDTCLDFLFALCKTTIITISQWLQKQ